MKTALRIAPREGYHVMMPQQAGHGVSVTYRREIYGMRFSFTFVTLPNGELRWFVRKWIPEESSAYPEFPYLGKWVRTRQFTLYPDGSYKGQRFDN